MNNKIKSLGNGDFQVVPLDDPEFIKFQENRNLCYCYKCNIDRRDSNGIPYVLTRMIVCPECGNKRCPHSTDHNLECTGSNDPGQKGSRY